MTKLFSLIAATVSTLAIALGFAPKVLSPLEQSLKDALGDKFEKQGIEQLYCSPTEKTQICSTSPV